MVRFAVKLRGWWTALKQECLRDPDMLLFERPGDIVPIPKETIRATN